MHVLSRSHVWSAQLEIKQKELKYEVSDFCVHSAQKRGSLDFSKNIFREYVFLKQFLK